MGTVITSFSKGFPATFPGAIVETADTWDDDWTFDPDLALDNFALFASSTAASTAEIYRRYGNTKFPSESSFTKRSSRDMTGQWIRISLIGDDGNPNPQFVGQVDGQATKLQGNDKHVAGQQTFTVSGGLKILQKLSITNSVFLNSDSSYSVAGWIPGMNMRDSRNLLVGNRCDTKAGDGTGFYYGGKSVWTHLTYLQYLITNFIQQTESDDVTPTGPTWTVGGQSSILDTMKTTIEFNSGESAADMLRKLIPVKYGVDWFVTPTDAGFEITVFALINQSTAIAGVSLPSNPNVITIDKGQYIQLTDVSVVESEFRRVDRVQVLGKRIVVCGTLWGARSLGGGTPSDKPGDTDDATLVPKWSTDLQTDYISAGGTTGMGTILTYEAIRKREKYKEVFQHFGAPVDWDMDGRAWSVSCNDDGTLSTDDYQVNIRETLGWLPMKEGFDYTQNPPVNNSLGQEEAVKPAMGWIWDEGNPTGAVATLDPNSPPRYVQVELAGIGTHTPFHDWGLDFHSSPAIAICKNHLTAVQITTFLDQNLFYDWDTLIATVAIESDHRIMMAYSVPDDLAAGDGSVMTVMDEECELWCVLHTTVADLDTDGNLVYVAGTKPHAPLVLRDDRPRLALTLAGIVSRYVNDRVKCTATWRGFQPWMNMMGYILSVVSQGDNQTTIGGPVTSVQYRMGDEPTMTIKAGYM